MAAVGEARTRAAEDEYLDILSSNLGFGSDPGRWLDYARAHGFRRVRAEALLQCPDCGARRSRVIGQYVYYSTLMHLRECRDCGLWYSDSKLDAGVVADHFSRAYKDEDYFSRQRAPVFRQLCALIDEAAPPGGSVLDIGGAKGHLMAMLRARRPDLALAVTDLSPEACAWAERTFGFSTHAGSIAELEGIDRQFDVVVLSDVIYYEPDPRTLWRVLPKLVRPGGAVIIRAPNTALLIRLGEWIRRMGTSPERRARADVIRFFNMEHALHFPRRFLARRLADHGFRNVRAHPGAIGAMGFKGAIASVVHALSTVVTRLTGGRVVPAHSYVLVARRGESTATGAATRREAAPRRRRRTSRRWRGAAAGTGGRNRGTSTAPAPTGTTS